MSSPFSKGWSGATAWGDIPVFIPTASKRWGNWDHTRLFRLQIRRDDASGAAELWLYLPNSGMTVYYSIQLLHPYVATVVFGNTPQSGAPSWILPPNNADGDISTNLHEPVITLVEAREMKCSGAVTAGSVNSTGAIQAGSVNCSGAVYCADWTS